MRAEWNNIRTWNTKRFSVTLDWAWEDSPDLSWDETGETIANIENGAWGCYAFRTRVVCDGREIGADYLGNSVYANPEEFYLEHIGIRAKARDAGVNYGCYFTDMMHEAIAEARKSSLQPAACSLRRLIEPRRH